MASSKASGFTAAQHHRLALLKPLPQFINR